MDEGGAFTDKSSILRRQLARLARSLILCSADSVGGKAVYKYKLVNNKAMTPVREELKTKS